jgi:hypothetical protein
MRRREPSCGLSPATTFRRFLGCWLALMLTAGCTQSASPPEASGQRGAGTADTGKAVAPVAADDPCAIRLHDRVCQALLMYIALRDRLPDKLDDLLGYGQLRESELICPVSGEKYVYYPSGILLLRGQQPGRVIVYDPRPSHGGFRWGIALIEATGRSPLSLRVFPLEDSVFTFDLRP